jgi:SAM-dependent methyltransferase
MPDFLRQLRDRLAQRRQATRLTQWPTGAPLKIDLYASAADLDHIALALDAIETFHPGSSVVIHADVVLKTPARANDSHPQSTHWRRLGDHDPSRFPDILLRLHPFPWLDPAKRRHLGPVRRAFRRALQRHPQARPWLLFRNMELWDGAPRAAFQRRLIDLALRPVAAWIDRRDASRLRRLVLPRLSAAEHWNAPAPCAHPRAVRVFDTPRAIDFCPDCGMGLTPAGTVPPLDATRAIYGPGYALGSRYTGRREFERYVAETVGRIAAYLQALKLPAPPERQPDQQPVVLDYGCGNGRLAPLWLARGWRYVGIDFSPPNVAFARNLIARLHPDADARLFVGSIDSPDLQRAAPFDLIVLCHVIEHVPDPAALLAALRQLTRPGGWIYIEAPDGPRYTWNLRHRGYANTEHVWDFTPPMLAATARHAGWSDPRIHRDPDDERYPFIALLAQNP